MKKVVISGTGLYIPEFTVSNDELVESYNRYVDLFNEQHRLEIATGEISALTYSSSDFIVKASGIEQRYVMVKEGILNPQVMMPLIESKPSSDLSMQAEMAIQAATDALNDASVTANEIDLIIVACAYTERAYPAIAIEVQQALRTSGFAYDMLVACSSATFAINNAVNAIRGGSANRVLVINPELTSPQSNFKDRDSHFIFGDVATALVVERDDLANKVNAFAIHSMSCKTNYSNNIRSNFGFVNRCDPQTADAADKLFHQQGRKVFKELLPMIYQHLEQHFTLESLKPEDFKRLWLHQANINMNLFVVKKLLGDNVASDKAPIVLNEFANTASAGSVIAFHRHKADFKSGELGLLCSFGAGYSIGSVVLEKC
ncbi:beta-ketoacyl-ACP synthase III [Shewanella intestini]|uniref:Beta-ketoacyl-ACP synthase III n=1 Tax=Shewanella intestini TaxID=2017544 RepID=A0ABS5HYT7_9GAMM|nr:MULTISPECIES: beta-ketoacyl-ACP synthase III [Shewanella]MBR9726960.1 beta-ketoacyl-ACP synthase III [Shewanella intestini]MRG34474.1 beta-ketoacyl-ACP synthase III [Shewanella sp. XMDDZSB0408]